MVSESATVGAELVRVLAVDADSEERGTITYSLSADGEVYYHYVHCIHDTLHETHLVSSDRMAHLPLAPAQVPSLWQLVWIGK